MLFVMPVCSVRVMANLFVEQNVGVIEAGDDDAFFLSKGR